jgi:hypothetical protein
MFIYPEDRGIQLWKHALLERSCNIKSTHVEVGRVDCPSDKRGKGKVFAFLKSLFSSMQASKWSPNGESRTFLMKQRLTHASMSIGDCVQIGRDLYIVGSTGFVQIEEAAALLPPALEEDLLLDEVEDSTPLEPKKGKKSKHKAKTNSYGDANDAEGEHEGARKDGKGKGRKDREKKNREDAGEATKGGKGGKAAKGAKGGGKGKTTGNGADDRGVKASATSDRRLDRRHLRKQLQAEREKVQTGA